ncbi:LacI family transcriptional regulator [Starkeya sp. ORNL1]|uniref:LacI family DNA-binding transcriptional regulator n=1 Tax=Starkeya sp. ORNL1 TaxID=2709380 RepID=UPI0014635D41|nr:LacI family DNA-binding transcriptional regulator [Starkeya sp. ORNL1]QJP14810.1 LacI family transcriptional regulator [Starkeya sp. ORNL1]
MSRLDKESGACYFPFMSGKRRTTIRDVAAAAGVSVTTVSDALSGKGRLPEPTRLKVKAVAEKLNYRPSAIALGLREGGLGMVGICIAPAAGNAILTDVGYWAAIVTHASQAILAEGLAPVLLPHSVDLLGKLKIPLDGAIVVDPLENDPVLSFFEKRKVRYVTIGRDLGRKALFWVDDDNETGISRLLERTVAPGTPLAFITVGPKKSYVADALNGARQWARDHRSPIDIHHCEGLESRQVDAAVGRALDGGAGALIAQVDRLALRILASLKERKLRVPDDVRLLSASDGPELDQTSPPISAVRQHPGVLADLAAAALLGLIRGKIEVKSGTIPMETVVRPSAPEVSA